MVHGPAALRTVLLFTLAGSAGAPPARWSASVAGPIRVGHAEIPPAALDPRAERRELRVTAYCDLGLTASGVPSGPGQCAAPADVPFGSLVYIPALDRTLLVTDRTHRRFRHNTIDIFMDSARDCRRFGRRQLECIIIPPPTPHRYACERLLHAAREFADRVAAADAPAVASTRAAK